MSQQYAINIINQIKLQFHSLQCFQLWYVYPWVTFDVDYLHETSYLDDFFSRCVLRIESFQIFFDIFSVYV